MVNTNRLALGNRAESVCVSFAAAVLEFATDAADRIVEEFRESASALATVRRQVAHVLSMEFAAKTFALFLGLESIRIAIASTVNERLASLVLIIIVISSDIVIAVARIDRRIADRTLRSSLNGRRWCDSDVMNWWSCGGRPLAFSFAGGLILETIFVPLTATVLEFVA